MPANMLTSCACFLARTSTTDSPSQKISSLSGKMNQSHSLQWRDRTGLSPASILASADPVSFTSYGRTHRLFCLQRKVYHLLTWNTSYFFAKHKKQSPHTLCMRACCGSIGYIFSGGRLAFFQKLPCLCVLEKTFFVFL